MGILHINPSVEYSLFILSGSYHNLLLINGEAPHFFYGCYWTLGLVHIDQTGMKYSLVTGGSRGLGRAVCIKLAQMGIPVLINYQSNQQAAEEVRNLIISNGGEASLMKFNVADKEEVSAALEAWEKEHPDDYIAYLVNNAGIRRDNVMFMMPDEDWHSVINTTLNGFFYVTRHLLPKMMMRKHGGRIVNMASLSGLKGMAGQTNYSAAKAALIGAGQITGFVAKIRPVWLILGVPNTADSCSLELKKIN